MNHEGDTDRYAGKPVYEPDSYDSLTDAERKWLSENRFVGRGGKKAPYPKVTEAMRRAEWNKRNNVKPGNKDRHSETFDDNDFYSDLDEVDSQIQRFVDPDERRRKFLSGQVAGSEQGRRNVEKLSGEKLKKAAMMAGALQTGRAPSLVREGVEKRMAGG